MGVVIVVWAPFLLDVKAQNLDQMARTKLEELESWGAWKQRELAAVEIRPRVGMSGSLINSIVD